MLHLRRFVVYVFSFVVGATAGSAAAPVSVRTVTGETLRGQVRSWTLDGKMNLEMEKGQARSIDSLDIGEIGLEPAARAQNNSKWSVETWSGTRLSAEPSGGNQNEVQFKHPQLGAISLSLDDVKSIISSSAKGRAIPPPAEEDVVLLANGDATRGTVSKISSEGLTLTDHESEKTIPWRVVHAVAMARPDKPPASRRAAMIDLTDGSRLVAVELNWEHGILETKMSAGAALHVPEAIVEYIEVIGGRRTWLSDVSPSHYEHTPFLSRTWPYRLNQCAAGGPLVVGGHVHRHGIGLHSACRIAWPLEGGFQRFTAGLAIDDSGGGLADVDVKVSLDGRGIADFKSLRFGEAPRAIDVSIAGGRELSIEVGFGQNGDVQDRLDLLDAALIR